MLEVKFFFDRKTGEKLIRSFFTAFIRSLLATRRYFFSRFFRFFFVHDYTAPFALISKKLLIVYILQIHNKSEIFPCFAAAEPHDKLSKMYAGKASTMNQVNLRGENALKVVQCLCEKYKLKKLFSLQIQPQSTVEFMWDI